MTYPDGRTISYQRDALGRITSVSYDDKVIATYYWLGSRIIAKTIGDFEYSAVIDSLGRTEVESYNGLGFEYDYLNHTYRLTARNTIDYGYDTLGRVTSEDAASYTCDILGNPTNATEDNLIYTLDNEDRVTQVNDVSSILAQYTYDRLGKRTSKTANSETTYFAYDKFGNVIAEYIQDGNSVVWQKDYVYGALGELIYMQLPKTTTSNQDAEDLMSFLDAWLCNPDCTQDNLYWDFDDNNQINFVDWAGYCDDFAEAFRDNGRYVLTDFRGSVIGATDANGSLITIGYNAWGTPSYTGDLEGLNVLWNGYYLDGETGNYYLRNRYYSPLERKFVTQDPRGINPDENWNNPFDAISQYRDGFGLQVYATGDPINNTDPWGLKSICCKIKTTTTSYMPPGMGFPPGMPYPIPYKTTTCSQQTIAGCEGQKATKTCKCHYRGNPDIKVDGANDKKCEWCTIDLRFRYIKGWQRINPFKSIVPLHATVTMRCDDGKYNSYISKYPLKDDPDHGDIPDDEKYLRKEYGIVVASCSTSQEKAVGVYQEKINTLQGWFRSGTCIGFSTSTFNDMCGCP